MHVCISPGNAIRHSMRTSGVRISGVHLVYALVAYCDQKAYMHKQPTEEFGVRIVAGST